MAVMRLFSREQRHLPYYAVTCTCTCTCVCDSKLKQTSLSLLITFICRMVVLCCWRHVSLACNVRAASRVWSLSMPMLKKVCLSLFCCLKSEMLTSASSDPRQLPFPSFLTTKLKQTSFCLVSIALACKKKCARKIRTHVKHYRCNSVVITMYMCMYIVYITPVICACVLFNTHCLRVCCSLGYNKNSCQSCPTSHSSNNRADTPPAKQQRMCESVCLLANQQSMSFCAEGSALQCFHQKGKGNV